MQEWIYLFTYSFIYPLLVFTNYLFYDCDVMGVDYYRIPSVF